MAESDTQTDDNLDLVEISVVSDRYLAEICVKALREHNFHAQLEKASGGGLLSGIIGAMMGRAGGSQSILVPKFQADEAKAYLDSSRLLGPE